MGFPLFLALAGLGDDTLDQINQVGWFLPFFALVIPVALILFLVLGEVGYLLLAIAQTAAISYGLRVLVARFRRERFSSYQVKLSLVPCYLIACFVTNILTLLVIVLIRKIF